MPRMRRLLLAVLATSLVVLAPPAVAADGDRAEPDWSVTAHRGGPGKGPGENTLPAFRESIRHGATAIETDLRRTRDDGIVVLHDSGVGRTTSCAGPIGDWTLARLDRLCVEDSTGRPLPHLADLLAFAAAHPDVSFMVELKGSNWSPAQIRSVVRQVKDADLVDRFAVSSLRATVLARVRRLAPRLGNQLIVAGWPKVHRTLGTVDGYNVPASALTRARMRRLERRGLTVVGGDSSTTRAWERYQRVGVDGVVTSSVRAYRTWLDARV